jgi:hypothetical protein
MDDEVYDIEEEAIRCWHSSSPSSWDESRSFDIADAIYAAQIAGSSDYGSLYRFSPPSIGNYSLAGKRQS